MGLIILTSSPAPRASRLGFEWRIFPQWHSWQCSSMHQFTLRRMVELGLLLGSVACEPAGRKLVVAADRRLQQKRS